ncbi:MAG: ureidoglycolate dehydrogenase [Coriobacteriales bacterium]|nr:ureidoglycolate dehydrogenase [Coriobacteriales bacterium]
MSNQDFILLSKDEITQLITHKLERAGLPTDQATQVADHLAYADSLGVHSHGTVRVEYYAERISKGGSTVAPNIVTEVTGPCSAVIDGDNAVGFVVANLGMSKAIEMARENGVAFVGMKRLGHCGTLSYYLRKATAEGLVAISMCQSDPMAVPFGGAQPFFGTNPIGFGCPALDGQPIVFDMATTVQAWGKVLDARARNRSIPNTWAVDATGAPTTDPFAVAGLSAVAGAKGYGLMMMVDILAGSLLGVPFGPHVSSMYDGLDRGRGLGQIHIVINPTFFGNAENFRTSILAMIEDLHKVKPAPGTEQVLFPGERSKSVADAYRRDGIPVVKEIYDYLCSDAIYNKSYELGDPFAVQR